MEFNLLVFLCVAQETRSFRAPRALAVLEFSKVHKVSCSLSLDPE